MSVYTPTGGGANPTFTGIVTMPDGSTWTAEGISLNSAIIVQAGLSYHFTLNTSNFHQLSLNDAGLYYRSPGRTLVIPYPAANTAQDGQAFLVGNFSTGTLTLIQAPSFGGTPTGGTFALTITGFTQLTGIAYNVPAATLQTSLSNGINGPAGTTVTLVPAANGAPPIYVVMIPGALGMTADFSGLIPTNAFSLLAPLVDNQGQIVIPPKTAVWLVNDGQNYYTFGTMNRGSSTGLFAVATTPAPATGVAFTPNANQDCELSFAVATAGTFSITYGPSTGAENTILTATALAIGTFFNKGIPANWKVIITGTIASLENILAVTK